MWKWSAVRRVAQSHWWNCGKERSHNIRVWKWLRFSINRCKMTCADDNGKQQYFYHPTETLFLHSLLVLAAEFENRFLYPCYILTAVITFFSGQRNQILKLGCCLLCSQVVEILQKLYACGADDLGLNFINELTVRFCHCPKWVGRQAFAFICQVCGDYHFTSH